MSFLDRLFGRDDQPNQQQQQRQQGWGAGGQLPAGQPRPDQRTPDEIALERYRYLLRTAPPEDIERAHAEAFANLTPEQRRLALEQLAQYVPESEMRNASDDPQSLARLATRAELQQPGTVERALGAPQGQQGRQGQGMGMPGMGMPGMGSILLYSLAGSFIGTAIASTMFANHGYPPGDPAAEAGGEGANIDEAGYDENAGGESGAGEGGDYGQSSGGSWDDAGGSDAGTADAGGDFGGGDFGGGDFGGGDFGGGDFG